MDTIDKTIDPGSDGTMQILSFIMESEEYAVDILSVQEIRGWTKPTPVPNTPPYVIGVMNIRGTIMPVINLHMMLGMSPVEYGRKTVIVVLRVATPENGSRCFGVVVDAVSDVYNVNMSEIHKTPNFGFQIEQEFAKGITTIEDRMLIILDSQRLLPTNQDNGSQRNMGVEAN